MIDPQEARRQVGQFQFLLWCETWHNKGRRPDGPIVVSQGVYDALKSKCKLDGTCKGCVLTGSECRREMR